MAFVVAAALPACRAPAARRDRVVIAQPTSAITFDPHHQDSYHTNLALSHFCDKLVMLGAGLELKPSLATSWENPSEHVWRFHLRRGVVFHDGRPFGAADVVASLNRARAPDAHVKHYLQPVESVTAIDDATVELTTREPSVALLYDLVFISIVPRDAGAAPITRPIGTGPYTFTTGSPGAPIEGTRFARYWGTAPAFEKVVLLPAADARGRADAVPQGRADIVVQFPEELWEWGRTQPHTVLVTRDVPDVFMLSLSMRPGAAFADR